MAHDRRVKLVGSTVFRVCVRIKNLALISAKEGERAGPETGVVFSFIAVSMIKKRCPDGNVQLEIKNML